MGLSPSYNFASILRSIRFGELRFPAVFPAMQSWYVRNPIAAATKGGKGTVDSVSLAPVAAAARPKSKEDLNRLGVRYARFGYADRAVETLKRSASLDRSYVNPRINLGNAYFIAGQYEKTRALSGLGRQQQLSVAVIDVGRVAAPFLLTELDTAKQEGEIFSNGIAVSGACLYQAVGDGLRMFREHREGNRRHGRGAACGPRKKRLQRCSPPAAVQAESNPSPCRTARAARPVTAPMRKIATWRGSTVLMTRHCTRIHAHSAAPMAPEDRPR